MTNQPYEGATPQQLQHPMVRELLAIHGMFRREMETMLRFITDLIEGQQQLTETEITVRIHTLIRAGMQYTHMLHHHHTLETSFVFPALRNEDPAIAPVIDRLNAEHDEIAVMIDQFSEGVEKALAVEPRVLDTDLRRLADALHQHLAYEETHVCPVLTRMSRWPI